MQETRARARPTSGRREQSASVVVVARTEASNIALHLGHPSSKFDFFASPFEDRFADHSATCDAVVMLCSRCFPVARFDVGFP